MFADDNGDDDPTSSQPSPVTAESLDNYLRTKNGSPLVGQGDNFMKWGLHYNVDPRLMVSIAGAESGFGKNLKAGAFNPFGLLFNRPDPYHSDFESWDHAIKGLGRSLSDGYNMSSTEDMYKKYCQSGNCSAGLNNINQFMQEQGADPNALHFPWPSQNDD